MPRSRDCSFSTTLQHHTAAPHCRTNVPSKVVLALSLLLAYTPTQLGDPCCRAGLLTRAAAPVSSLSSLPLGLVVLAELGCHRRDELGLGEVSLRLDRAVGRVVVAPSLALSALVSGRTLPRRLRLHRSVRAVILSVASLTAPVALLQLSAASLRVAVAATVITHRLSLGEKVRQSECISDAVTEVLRQRLAVVGHVALATAELAVLNLLDGLLTFAATDLSRSPSERSMRPWTMVCTGMPSVLST